MSTDVRAEFIHPAPIRIHQIGQPIFIDIFAAL